ncbi:hypothetical protein TRAPUB_950 [Trametes pubescens]|uniref:GSKIP domain-containing protein n=1 Tax=Trametes pubescens TaxID=154538 RepID=A0A1M2VKM5_TRAPU|nr:hypothetical protein TRAPUB_950 [Trametes pubescens]
MSSQEQSEPSSFMREELERALAEQSFAISSFETTSSSPLKATARVVLLEGEVVLVSLTSRGYQLHSPSEAPMDPDHDTEIIFETIEQLLQTVSPQFESAQRSALMEKLELLSDPA